jgi:phage N-6-adenine-methyltransferase
VSQIGLPIVAGEIVDKDAFEIGDLYRRARTGIVDSVRCLLECGRRLSLKQEAVGRGNWRRWLAENEHVLGFSSRQTAHLLMKAAENVKPALHLDEATALEISRQIWGHTKGEGNHRAQGTGENEWYTPARYIYAAREVMGGIDLDPATSAAAQQTIRAARFFTREQDGLAQPWAGRVWLNPPYSQPDIANFCRKLVAEVGSSTVEQAILLTHNYTDTAWFHEAESLAEAICFTRGRIKFVDAGGEECAPTQGQAFFYYGKGGNAFRSVFGEFGFVR